LRYPASTAHWLLTSKIRGDRYPRSQLGRAFRVTYLHLESRASAATIAPNPTARFQ
jgi:hypothetical protein